MSAHIAKLPTQKTFFDNAVKFGLVSAAPFALLWTWQMSILMGWPFRHVLPFGVVGGLAFGVFFGIGAGFMFRDVVVRVDIVDSLNFPSQLSAAMSRAGFKLAVQADDSFIYKPMLRSGLLTGEIWGEWNQDEAAVVGPSWHVNKLLVQLAREQQRSLQGSRY